MRPRKALVVTVIGCISANVRSQSGIVVVGTNGTILSSMDGIAWTEQTKPSNNDLNDVTWDGSQFVVVGSNDTILTSPDGIHWTWRGEIGKTGDNSTLFYNPFRDVWAYTVRQFGRSLPRFRQ